MESRVRQYQFPDILFESFRVYREVFSVICGVYLVPYLPFIALESYFFAYGEPAEEVRLAFDLFNNFVALLLLAPITVAVSDACLGNKPLIGRSFGRVLEVPGKLILTYLTFFVGVTIGLLLLLVPGILFAVYCSFALMIVVLERRSAIPALKRSISLVRGAFWKLCGLYLILLLLFGLYFALCMLTFLPLALQASWLQNPVFLFVFMFCLLAITIIATPMWYIPVVLAYYDRRVRKEDFDAAALMQDLRG